MSESSKKKSQSRSRSASPKRKETSADSPKSKKEWSGSKRGILIHLDGETPDDSSLVYLFPGTYSEFQAKAIKRWTTSDNILRELDDRDEEEESDSSDSDHKETPSEEFRRKRLLEEKALLEDLMNREPMQCGGKYPACVHRHISIFD